MTEPGSPTQISDVFYAATFTFDHLTNLALQLNRIDKQINLYDETCSMDSVDESVRKFTANLENASKLKQATYMRPYSHQARRTPAQPLNRIPVNADLTRSLPQKSQNNYRLMPATGLNALQNGSLIRQNSMTNGRKRAMAENGSYGPSKQIRDIQWMSVNGNSSPKMPMFARQSINPPPNKVNIRREYTVTPFRTGSEPQRFLVKKELFQSQNVTAITMDDLTPKLPNNSRTSPSIPSFQPLQPKPVSLSGVRPSMPLTEEDAAVSSLLHTLQQPDSEMSGAE
ncbi:unnamed protein product [Bursaphelenchus xylophilus]|uniref:(pine wood nematode) hypothetical protein n=1 Tax=Bursaphelenchus xylophilus TaxID=6326 RepID=A0A1I7RR73_BURXY|nr:unnamed protein product [Bursaphelenchus xylophilus]CAG9130863.1 unnamed protein product [Bursaphelenchus xylophilus]